MTIDPTPKVGTNLVIEIRVQGQPAILVRGRVVRRVVPPAGARTPGGVGIEIIPRTPEWTAFCGWLASTRPASVADRR